MRSDAMKRQFAIHGMSIPHPFSCLTIFCFSDYARTQKALASCPFCFGSDDSPPKAPVIAMATRVYLSCTLNEELIPGHCLIVPIQHHLNMLEGDDDVWDEVRVIYAFDPITFPVLNEIHPELYEMPHADVCR
jgi:Protein similar to CwfJ C-terminus 1